MGRVHDNIHISDYSVTIQYYQTRLIRHWFFYYYTIKKKGYTTVGPLHLGYDGFIYNNGNNFFSTKLLRLSIGSLSESYALFSQLLTSPHSEYLFPPQPLVSSTGNTASAAAIPSLLQQGHLRQPMTQIHGSKRVRFFCQVHPILSHHPFLPDLQQ